MQALEDRAEAVAEGELPQPAALRSMTVVSTQWPHVRADLLRRGIPQRSVAAADAAIRTVSLHRATLRIDANELTAPFAPLFAMLGDRVPTPVHRLDYLARAVVLDAAVGHWQISQDRARDLNATWSALRSDVMRRNLKVAAKFDAANAAVLATQSRHDLAGLKRA